MDSIDQVIEALNGVDAIQFDGILYIDFYIKSGGIELREDPYNTRFVGFSKFMKSDYKLYTLNEVIL